MCSTEDPIFALFQSSNYSKTRYYLSTSQAIELTMSSNYVTIGNLTRRGANSTETKPLDFPSQTSSLTQSKFQFGSLLSTTIHPSFRQTARRLTRKRLPPHTSATSGRPLIIDRRRNASWGFPSTNRPPALSEEERAKYLGAAVRSGPIGNRTETESPADLLIRPRSVAGPVYWANEWAIRRVIYLPRQASYRKASSL